MQSSRSFVVELLNGVTGNPPAKEPDSSSDSSFCTQHSPPDDFRYPFAYTVLMFQGPSNRKGFVVSCKRCRRDVLAGVQEFPFQSVVVACPLCGEQRRYLPSEVFLGRPDQRVAKQMKSPLRL